ncbi:MAG TPA: phosphatase PAP2 family protein [Acidimicrobiales bacterium]|nr:phosphatase PAP2 family protein [Acidimicrobiales bacterium]
MDKQWYMDVNRFARNTSWAHGFMTAYYQRAVSPVGAGLLVLAGLIALAWWSARRQPQRLAAVVWSALAAVVSFGLAQILLQVLARPRPYQVLSHVEVLVPRGSARSYAMPNSHAVIAGAVVCGLLLAWRWRLALVAFVATLLLLFSGVYVGSNYPSDVAAGAGFGAVVALVLWPLGSWLLAPVIESIAAGPFGWLAVSRVAKRPSRPLLLHGSATKLPTAKAMDALRLATEAARHAPPAEAPAPTTTAASIRTTAVRTAERPDGSSAAGEAS